jgi:NADH-quinone oxidoreductase subunit C
MSEENVKPVDPERAARDAARAERMAARKAAQAAKEAAEAAEAGDAAQPVQAEPEAAVSASEPASAEPASETKAVDPQRAARDAARAERMAARKAAQAAADAPASGGETPASAAAEDPASGGDSDRAARDAARAERAAARAAAKAAEEGGGDAAAPKEPSPNQPKLDRLVEIVKEHVGEAAILEAYINERDRHLPVIVVDKAHWLATAELLRDHAELKLNYLRNVSGVDYETHLEVMYYLIGTSEKRDYAVKVRTDREQAEIPSVASVWSTTNWNEREIYDLLGVTFTGHPNMTRIMLPDDWVGHPLRKDYEPIDPEV